MFADISLTQLTHTLGDKDAAADDDDDPLLYVSWSPVRRGPSQDRPLPVPVRPDPGLQDPGHLRGCRGGPPPHLLLVTLPSGAPPPGSGHSHQQPRQLQQHGLHLPPQPPTRRGLHLLRPELRRAGHDDDDDDDDDDDGDTDDDDDEDTDDVTDDDTGDDVAGELHGPADSEPAPGVGGEAGGLLLQAGRHREAGLSRHRPASACRHLDQDPGGPGAVKVSQTNVLR